MIAFFFYPSSNFLRRGNINSEVITFRYASADVGTRSQKTKRKKKKKKGIYVGTKAFLLPSKDRKHILENSKIRKYPILRSRNGYVTDLDDGAGGQKRSPIPR